MTDVKIATREAYGKALVELGKEDQNIIVLDADLSVSTKTALFAKAFPDRFFDIGISEQDLISTSVGIASCGKTVFASTFAIFGSGRAWDQIRMCCAYANQNVKVVVTHGGITTGEDGASHQANEDVAIIRASPDMTVIVPSDAISTEKTIRAIAKTYGPFYVRLSRFPTPLIYQNRECNFEIGKGILLKEGKDATVFACGVMVSSAILAASELEADGISVDVVDIHTIKPIDKELIIARAQKTGAVVTAEEHSVIGGLGGAVAEVLAENNPVPIQFVGIKDTFGESGKPEELLVKYGLTPQDIVKAVKAVIARKK